MRFREGSRPTNGFGVALAVRLTWIDDRDAKCRPTSANRPGENDPHLASTGTTRPRGALRNGVRRFDLAERAPAHLKERLAGRLIFGAEISDVREHDADRISPLRVGRFLARTVVDQLEEDGVSDGERRPVRQWEDRAATAATLDVRDPLFTRGIGVHRRPRSMKGWSINVWCVDC